MSTYLRCTYIPDGGIQCDNWVRSEVSAPDIKCPLHVAHLMPDGPTKTNYIAVRNTEADQCFKMSFEELDAHIAGLEAILETEKAKLYSARAVRADKLDKLSEEEREVRRKIQRERKEEKISPEKPKKATIKSDPIRFFMQTFNISEAEAKTKLGLA